MANGFTRRRSNQRSRRNQRNREEEKASEIIEDSQVVDAYLCSQLGQYENKLALNASSQGDECPICNFGWSEFNEPKIAAILPCNHAFCASCLLKYHACCTDSSIIADERCNFACPLCRLQLSATIFEGVAQAFVHRRLMPSFETMAKKLPFSQDYLDNLIVSLLAKHHSFDLSKVEHCLFNMVGLVDPNPNEQLNTDEKQKIYETARITVNKFRSELLEIRESLFNMDTESDEGKAKIRELQDVKQKLGIAMQNAARDIYEQVNSKENVVYVINGKDILGVDLHGLRVEDFKGIVDEHILPVLDVVGQIVVITGRGLHSQSGVSVLKGAVKDYFNSLGIRCEDVARNDGAFFVFRKTQD